MDCGGCPPPAHVAAVWDAQDRAKEERRAKALVASGKIRITGRVASMRGGSDAGYHMGELLAVAEIGLATGFGLYRESGEVVRRYFHVVGSRSTVHLASLGPDWRPTRVDGRGVLIRDRARDEDHEDIIARLSGLAR
jgi:hypothetical protein